jgi:hypothetical protein
MEMEKTESGEEINTHNKIVDFGKYKGERWTRLPISYLRFLINVHSQYRDVARAELKRRGTQIDGGIELSAHSVDRASLYLIPKWKHWRKKDEGLYSWLSRMCREALQYGFINEGEVDYHGMKFIFIKGDLVITLKTIYKTKSWR